MIKENNKLKLDNAALRAENQILKRQLNYFEQLFAQRAQLNSPFESQAPTPPTEPVSIHGEIHRRSDPRMYNAEKHDSLKSQSLFSQPLQTGEVDTNQTPSEAEVSFVLERNVPASTPGTKLGLFSLALVCCICCFSSFFGTHTDITSGFYPEANVAPIGGDSDQGHLPIGSRTEGLALQGADVQPETKPADEITEDSGPSTDSSSEEIEDLS